MSQALTKLAKGQIRHGVVFEEKSFLARLKQAHQEAEHVAESAVNKALIVGQMLVELKGFLGHGNWLTWLKEVYPEFHPRKAQRWMEVAEGVMKCVGLEADGIKQLPWSVVLSSPAEDLPAEAREAQQLVFDFTEGKTMKECLEGVVVDGDEPHRITRAHNGKTKGGSKGENRKDFPKFIANKLSDVSTHLESWDSMTAAQRGEIHDHFERALEAWPTPLLEKLAAQLKKEMQKR